MHHRFYRNLHTVAATPDRGLSFISASSSEYLRTGRGAWANGSVASTVRRLLSETVGPWNVGGIVGVFVTVTVPEGIK